jgi:ferric-dicitrate binding protein FerR (iron transport regulator)
LGRPYTEKDAREEAAAAAALPPDPEIQPLAEYVAGALPDEEADRIEERLATDPGYRHYAQPLLRLWAERPPLVEGVRAEVDSGAAWERLQRSAAAAPPVEVAPPESADREPSSRPKARAGKSLGAPRREILWRRAILAAVVVSVLVPESMRFIANTASLIIRPTKIVTVDQADGKVHTVTEGAVAALQQGSRLMYRAEALANGTWELYLDGSARFSIEGKEGRHFVVITPSARVMSDHGSFSVDARDPGATRVDLDAGHLTLESRGTTPPQRLGMQGVSSALAPHGQAPRLAQ